MGFPPHLLLLLVLLLPVANSDKLDLVRCEKSSDNQNLLSNAHTVVVFLGKKTHITGFSQFSYGKGAEAVHGLSWCRAELPSHYCSKCIFEASEIIRKDCPGSIAARSWFGDFCYLRFDTNDFVGKPDRKFVKAGYSKKKVNNPEHQSSFVITVRSLLNVLKLAKPENNKAFVTAKRWFYAENSMIYGKAQCSKDLTAEGCSLCLGAQLSLFDQYCRYRKSCEVLSGSCFMRYYTKK